MGEALYSMAQIEAAIRAELLDVADEVESAFATVDTNDGSVYCNHCGAPQKRKWKHDGCPVALLRERAATPKRSKA